MSRSSSRIDCTAPSKSHAFRFSGSPQNLLRAAGLPDLPVERELEYARRELRNAVMQGEWQRVPSLHADIEELEEQLEATKDMLRKLERNPPVPVRDVQGPRREPQTSGVVLLCTCSRRSDQLSRSD